MSESSGDKNHQASALRRQKARTDGDFARSFELAVALQVIGFTMLAMMCLGSISNWISTATMQTWQTASVSTSGLSGDDMNVAGFTNAADVGSRGLEMVQGAVWTIAPLMLGCWLVVIASHWIQTGPVWLPGKASPDLSRVSPGNWWRQSFSLSNCGYLFIGVPKFLLAITVATISFWQQRETIFSMAYQPTDQMGQTIAEVLMQICFLVGVVLLISSAIDYWIHYLGFEKRIRMTDQEMREEAKAQDGDPTVAAQRRALANRFHRARVAD